jgi:hypothetical protein
MRRAEISLASRGTDGSNPAPLQQTVRLSRDFSFLYRKAGRCRGVRGLGQAAQPTETRTARHNHAHCR